MVQMPQIPPRRRTLPSQLLPLPPAAAAAEAEEETAEGRIVGEVLLVGDDDASFP